MIVFFIHEGLTVEARCDWNMVCVIAEGYKPGRKWAQLQSIVELQQSQKGHSNFCILDPPGIQSVSLFQREKNILNHYFPWINPQYFCVALQWCQAARLNQSSESYLRWPLMFPGYILKASVKSLSYHGQRYIVVISTVSILDLKGVEEKRKTYQVCYLN